jgi:VWFA-related protein
VRRRLVLPRLFTATLMGAAALLAVSARTHGQSGARQPTFRAEVELVEVPVLVTDRADEFVADLTAEDFELSEDGRPQAIETFAAIDIPMAAFTSSDVEAHSDVATNEHGQGRIYLVVLDDLHITARHTGAVRRLLRDFLRTQIYRNDLVAIVQTGGMSQGVRELTNDRARLVESLEFFTGQKLPRPPKGCADPLDLARAYNVRAAMNVLGAMTRYLSGIHGRKASLLFISEGVDYDIYDMMGDAQTEAEAVNRQIEEAIAAALRNNVVVYSIDPRALFTRTEDDEPDAVVPCRPIDTRGRDLQGRIGRMSPLLSPPAELERARRSLQSLRHIAEQTGGVAVVDRNTYDQAFSRIVRENTQYYLLGYYPATLRADGRFRRIDVKVKRPGVSARARKGYVAPKRPMAESGARQQDMTADLALAMQSPVPLNGLTLRAQAAAVSLEGESREALVVTEVGGESLELAHVDDRYIGGVEVALLDIASDGRPGRVMQQRFDMRLTAAEHDRLRASALRAIWRVPLTPGRRHVRLAARDTRSGRAGSLVLDVEVPAPDGERPALGGILLTSERARVAITPRAEPALSSSLPGPPSVSGVFSRDETITALVQIFDIRAGEHVTVRARVTSGSGGEMLSLDSRRIEGAASQSVSPYEFTVPLRELTPGLYVLTVELEQHGAVLERRQRTLEIGTGLIAPPDRITRETIIPIAHGPTSARREFHEVVIKDTDAWRRLWGELPTRQPCPEIDFSRFMVVGVFLGDRTGLNSQAQIVGVRRDGAGVVILYSDHHVGQAPGRERRPFALAGIQRADVPVTFERVSLPPR